MQNSLNQRSKLLHQVSLVSCVILGLILGNRAADLLHTWLRGFLNPWANYPALQLVEVGAAMVGLLVSWHLGRRGWRRGQPVNARILALSFATITVLSAALVLAGNGIGYFMIVRPDVMSSLPPSN